jgi:hypothetical protein
MKRRRWSFVFLTALIIFILSACGNLDGGNVIITNNSNKEFYGRIWTDNVELYNGRIRAWNSKYFSVSEEGKVYTDFESSNGDKSNPSGYVLKNRTLILDL